MVNADDAVAATVHFLLALVAISFQVVALVVIRRSPNLRNAFGTLNLSHYIGNVVYLFVLGFIISPTILFQATEFAEGLGRSAGTLLVSSWALRVSSYFAISINRFFSILSSDKRRQIWTHRWTKVAVVVLWVYTFFSMAIYFGRPCGTVFEPKIWGFAKQFCGDTYQLTISDVLNFHFNILVVIVIFFIDMISLIILRSKFKVTGLPKTNLDAADLQKRQKALKHRSIETRLFTQVCIQGVLYITGAVVFAVINKEAKSLGSRWVVFLSETLTWFINNVLDAVVLLALHFRKDLFRPQKRSETSMVESRNKMLSKVPAVAVISSPQFAFFKSINQAVIVHVEPNKSDT